MPWRALATPIDPGWERQCTTPGFQTNVIARLDAKLPSIFPTDFDIGPGHRSSQLRYPHGHGASMPMFQDTAGIKPERIVLVRYFGRRQVGSEPDQRLVVLGDRVIKLDAL